MSSSPFHRYRALVPYREWAAFEAALGRPEPRTLRMRLGRTDPEPLVASLRSQGFRLETLPELPGVIRVDHEPFPLAETLEHWLGLFYIQQASTTLAAPSLAPNPGEGILDLCAAPGGKSSHLAELMDDRGCLVAVDLAEKRVRSLAGNLSRLAHPSVLSVVGDALLLPESAPFHRVLADVPCSGEGRSRRAGPVVASDGDLKRLPRLQEALLRKALRLVVPGGRVLYVTCTLAPEENEAVVDAVLRTQGEGPGASPPARLLPLDPQVPHARGLTSFGGQRWAADLEGAVRLHPHHLDSGGLFLALLERSDAPGPPPSSCRHLPGWTQPGTVLPAEARQEADADTRTARARDFLEDMAGTSVAARLLARRHAVRLHQMDAWPLETWRDDGSRVRILSAGLRVLEEGRGGRLRPTADLLRWLGPQLAPRGLELADETWCRLLDGAAVRPDPADLPPSAGRSDRNLVLLRQGHPLAPARLKGGRLLHELPPPRAQWLRQILSRPPNQGEPGGLNPGP